MTTTDYTETSRILRAEGHRQDDIDAAIESLLDSGTTYADEDELLLTHDEVEMLRQQLAT